MAILTQSDLEGTDEHELALVGLNIPTRDDDNDGVSVDSVVSMLEASETTDGTIPQEELDQITNELQTKGLWQIDHGEVLNNFIGYGEAIENYGLTKLRSIVHAQKVYNSLISEARNKALGTDKEIGNINGNRRYLKARIDAKKQYEATLRDLREFVLNEEGTLTPTKISHISEQYKSFKAKTRQNMYLGQVAKCMNPNDLKIESRVIAAAGLAMIGCYNEQELDTPCGSIIALGKIDAIRIAAIIAKHISKKGKVWYDDLIKHIGEEEWKSNIAGYHHLDLDARDPHQKNFHICDIFGRLVESEVLSGRLVPIKTTTRRYVAGLFFSINGRYIKK